MRFGLCGVLVFFGASVRSLSETPRSAAAGAALALALAPLLIPDSSQALSLQPGDLLVPDGGASAIFRVDPVTGAKSVVSSGGLLEFPQKTAIDTAGDLLVADLGANAIVRVDPLTGKQSVVSSEFSNLRDITIDAGGDLLVADISSDVFADAIIRVDPLTGEQSVVSSGGLFGNPVGIAIDPAGDLIVVDTVFSKIFRVDSSTGQQSVLGSIESPTGVVAVDAAGGILIGSVTGSNSGAIVRIDPVSGAQSVVSSGGFVRAPSGLAIDASGDLLVADIHDDVIIRVDPVTGAQSVVSSGFTNPRRLAIVPSASISVPEPSVGWLLLVAGSSALAFAGKSRRRGAVPGGAAPCSGPLEA